MFETIAISFTAGFLVCFIIVCIICIHIFRKENDESSLAIPDREITSDCDYKREHSCMNPMEVREELEKRSI